MVSIKDGKVEVPCPDCGENSLEPVDRLLDNEVIPCSLCGGLMDLSAEECRKIVAEARAYRAQPR
jgi:predicted RNA-binding Zn-ribbon protein involved in translation (DUF1610 family)